MNFFLFDVKVEHSTEVYNSVTRYLRIAAFGSNLLYETHSRNVNQSTDKQKYLYNSSNPFS